MSDTAFHDLIRRVRAGEARAAEEFFRAYEPQLRLEVRLRLRDPRLRRLIDDEDVCQSVLKTLFVRLRLGEYELTGPADLARLLAGIARNKVAGHARKQGAAQCDYRRAQALGAGELTVAAPGPSPSQVVLGEELLQKLRDRLGDEERQIAEMRADGRSWAEVVEVLGGTPGARRMQLERAVSRALQELGVEDTDE